MAEICGAKWWYFNGAFDAVLPLSVALKWCLRSIRVNKENFTNFPYNNSMLELGSRGKASLMPTELATKTTFTWLQASSYNFFPLLLFPFTIFFAGKHQSSLPCRHFLATYYDAAKKSKSSFFKEETNSGAKKGSDCFCL